jgi:hypothetical protein
MQLVRKRASAHCRGDLPDLRKTRTHQEDRHRGDHCGRRAIAPGGRDATVESMHRLRDCSAGRPRRGLSRLRRAWANPTVRNDSLHRSQCAGSDNPRRRRRRPAVHLFFIEGVPGAWRGSCRVLYCAMARTDCRPGRVAHRHVASSSFPRLTDRSDVSPDGPFARSCRRSARSVGRGHRRIEPVVCRAARGGAKTAGASRINEEERGSCLHGSWG